MYIVVSEITKNVKFLTGPSKWLLKKLNGKKKRHIVFTDPFQMCQLFSYCWWLQKKKVLNRHHFKLTTDTHNAIFTWRHAIFFYSYLHSRVSTHIQEKCVKWGKKINHYIASSWAQKRNSFQSPTNDVHSHIFI